MPNVTVTDVRIAPGRNARRAALEAAYERELAAWEETRRGRAVLADQFGHDHPDLPALPPEPTPPAEARLRSHLRVRARLGDGRTVEVELPMPVTRAELVAALREAVAALGPGSPAAEGEVLAV